MDFFESIQEILHHLEIYHDSYTKTHEFRTGKLMSILGRAYNLDKELCSSLEKSGSVHDIGKLVIPANILEKPGALSAFEREVVELHVKVGYELIKKLQHPLVELASTIILTHHEAYDGSGYPHGLKGEEIPIEGRICSICDVYDALMSHRPYREKQTHEKILQMMQDRGPKGLANKFDPSLLEIFININDQVFPLYVSNSSNGESDSTYR